MLDSVEKESALLYFDDAYLNPPLYWQDDGVDFRHEDLRESFDAEISHNFINKGGDIAPKPQNDETHGTRCAGIIAMTANNSKCGVGVAFRAKLGGLKVLDESQTLNDAIEGDSLAYKSDRIDIYSVSWGPRDDGRSAEKPGPLAQKALEYGTMHGRGGLGSLYVWASGNGGLEDDDCAMDGYASNLHTITLGVVSSSASPPWYAEGCGAVLASVTEGAKTTKGMVTTDVGNKCVYFSGTSAAAPLGAAVLALALEANPALSQRDVQHLIVRTSERDRLMKAAPNYWVVNGAGLPFSRYFGFGALNAQRLTKAATKWKRVEPMSSCAREITITNGTFAPGSPLLLDLPFHGCKGTSGEVNYLERVQLVVNVEHPRRGLISLSLTSPSGTTVQLLHPRKNDDSSDGLQEWPFLSVGHWGENPQGTWKLEATSAGSSKDIKAAGVLKFVRLTAHGTRRDPLKDNAFIIDFVAAA
ncbi:convertase P-domain protein [Oesophagostomum dentatum]|uniref:Convertase P-domain protein n=1 Tax=Oesophagostomum dentatum TaxID=61180 RepID=A0A0B1TG02_OESDE|nr:convertase P-domain protein [Oesophagostomum dentatum]